MQEWQARQQNLQERNTLFYEVRYIAMDLLSQVYRCVSLMTWVILIKMYILWKTRQENSFHKNMLITLFKWNQVFL